MDWILSSLGRMERHSRQAVKAPCFQERRHPRMRVLVQVEKAWKGATLRMVWCKVGEGRGLHSKVLTQRQLGHSVETLKAIAYRAVGHYFVFQLRASQRDLSPLRRFLGGPQANPWPMLAA